MKMLWNKNDLPKIFSRIDDLITGSGFKSYKEPAPAYALGPRWTDENRISHGYQLIEGEWCELTPVADYWSVVKKDIEKMMDEKSQLSKELILAKRRIYEMEYGLRVAEKALINSQKLLQENIDNVD
jgi:hypothetical protein